MNSRMDFCPKCGALARDGVCQSCGYTDPAIQPVEDQPVPPVQPHFQQNMYGQPSISQTTYQQGSWQYGGPVPPTHGTPKSHDKIAIIIAVIVAVIILALGVLLAVAVRHIDLNGLLSTNRTPEVSLEKEIESLPFYQPEDSEEFSSSGSYSYYTNDTTADNWNEEGQDPTFDFYSGPYNALRDDLDYQVYFKTAGYAPKDNDNVRVEIEYPIIKGDIENIDNINEALRYEYDYYINYSNFALE